MQKKIVHAVSIAMIGGLFMALPCQAADNDNTPIETAVKVDSTIENMVDKTANVQTPTPPLQVMLSAAADDEEEALLIAKKKAICKAVQYLQEKDLIHEYSAKVFSLADEYDKFIIAYNVRLEKSEAEAVTIAVRVDLNKELLQEHMAVYQIINTNHKDNS